MESAVEVDFCIQALERALRGTLPEIFNSEQGSQFTSFDFIEQLKKNKIRTSMDGRGRAMGNIFTERLWRSVKDEEVYVKDYQSIWEA